ncbi:hypothetical protein [Ligilactobacillus salivarius]|uniref:Uncharacterized protein n=1 Tax=Ligilactobacillus salivarius TaxID=1624 RepID=A0AAX3XBU8_9LACO|nr:hypothetical protein [Ligilactobacillus salivarius]WII29770.1 hypothetical protein QFE45_10915 [Ligilactobacillus salivarius]
MAQFQPDSGNKMSLRSEALDQIKRIDSISRSMGSLGDFLVSTLLSILASLVIFAIFPLLALGLSTTGAGLLKNSVPFVGVIIGSFLIALNALFVNPSQGSQLIISINYLLSQFGDTNKRYWRKDRYFKFSNRNPNRTVLESKYKGRTHYTLVYKVQGMVSQTSFDDDLLYLKIINKNAINSLEKDTIRTTVNFIGIPRTKPKTLNPNATREMQLRQRTLSRIVTGLQDTQVLETYIVLDNESYDSLMKKARAHEVFFNQGMVVTYHMLKGDELKKLINKLYANDNFNK